MQDQVLIDCTGYLFSGVYIPPGDYITPLCVAATIRRLHPLQAAATIRRLHPSKRLLQSGHYPPPARYICPAGCHNAPRPGQGSLVHQGQVHLPCCGTRESISEFILCMAALSTLDDSMNAISVILARSFVMGE